MQTFKVFFHILSTGPLTCLSYHMSGFTGLKLYTLLSRASYSLNLSMSLHSLTFTSWNDETHETITSQIRSRLIHRSFYNPTDTTCTWLAQCTCRNYDTETEHTLERSHVHMHVYLLSSLKYSTGFLREEYIIFEPLTDRNLSLIQPRAWDHVIYMFKSSCLLSLSIRGLARLNPIAPSGLLESFIS